MVTLGITQAAAALAALAAIRLRTAILWTDGMTLALFPAAASVKDADHRSIEITVVQWKDALTL